MDDRITFAASRCGLLEPFIAAVMTKIRLEWSDTVPTAGTNGKWMRFNPQWCAKLSKEQFFGLYLHEALHIVLMHPWRRGDRDFPLWNVANDALINRYILSRGYELPEGGVHIKWVTDEMDSEEVYRRLKDEQEKQGGGKGQGKGQGHGAGGFDGQGDLHDGDESADSAARADMEATIKAAAAMAKAAGQGSALIDRILSMDTAPKARWQDVLRNMLTESSRADYTYVRPSRRFIASGLYLPSLHSPAMGALMIGFDTSGSMSPEMCNQIGAEIRAIIDDVRPAFTEVAYCDYDVTNVQRFDPEDALALEPKGGGGTRFQPVFQHMEDSGDHYVGVVYFTDMEGDLNECVDPGIPVLWVNIGRREYAAPFGSVIQLEM